MIKKINTPPVIKKTAYFIMGAAVGLLLWGVTLAVLLVLN